MVRLKTVKYGEDLVRLEADLVGSRATLGEKHPDTLTLLSRLASTHKQLGRWDEAERLYLQCLEGRKDVLGGDHTDTLKVMGLLALVYEQQPRWHSKAQEMFDQVLQLRTSVLGELHKDTIVIARNRGHFFYKTNRHREAVDAYVLLFRKVRAVKGSFHPDTWMALMCVLAARFFAKLPITVKGEYKKALLLLIGSLLFTFFNYMSKDLSSWWFDHPLSPSA